MTQPEYDYNLFAAIKLACVCAVFAGFMAWINWWGFVVASALLMLVLLAGMVCMAIEGWED